MSRAVPKRRVILVRHGQTDFNREGRVQGVVDIPLNEDGHRQAGLMAPEVAAFSPTKLVASDLGRAVETARAIAARCGAEVVVDERLRERGFGSFEGATREGMTAHHPLWFQQWKETGECAKAGIESRRAVGERFAKAVEFHSEREQTLVVVSHGSAITQGMCVLLGLDPSEWMGLAGLNNCHWSVLEISARCPNWRLLAHNVGVTSLDEGRSMA